MEGEGLAEEPGAHWREEWVWAGEDVHVPCWSQLPGS